mmetsp:Transcript_16577/g.39684  ORF Transcript_16577/g.39684 Transcript_16577/m.39684 type:complete len:214 (+) Transcript_16577:702-1343(+)
MTLVDLNLLLLRDQLKPLYLPLKLVRLTRLRCDLPPHLLVLRFQLIVRRTRAVSILGELALRLLELFLQFLDPRIHDEAQAVYMLEVAVLDFFQFVLVLLAQCFYLALVLLRLSLDTFSYRFFLLVVLRIDLLDIGAKLRLQRRNSIAKITLESDDLIIINGNQILHSMHVGDHGILVQLLQVPNFPFEGADDPLLPRDVLFVVLDELRYFIV